MELNRVARHVATQSNSIVMRALTKVEDFLVSANVMAKSVRLSCECELQEDLLPIGSRLSDVQEAVVRLGGWRSINQNWTFSLAAPYLGTTEMYGNV